MSGEKFVRIKTMTNCGDLIASLSGIKAYCQEKKVKAIIYQFLDVENQPYKGATHPVRNLEGNYVCMNESMFNLIKPLIEYQSYIEKYEIYNGQDVDYDFDRVHHEILVNIPQGAIQNWKGLYFTDFQSDISEKWITTQKKSVKNKGTFVFDGKVVSSPIIVNITERYRNDYLTYFFLKPYETNLLFAGTKEEHELFCKRWALNISHLEVDNFLDLARAINDSRFILCNQSLCWNLAQSMQVPRLLELFAPFPNCIHGIGKASHGYYHQRPLQELFKKLYNKY